MDSSSILESHWQAVQSRGVSPGIVDYPQSGLCSWCSCLCLVFQVGIPRYLGLNDPWLCLLNNFLLGVVLCVHCLASISASSGLSDY